MPDSEQMVEPGEPLKPVTGKLFRATDDFDGGRGPALDREQLYKVTGQSSGDDLFLILDGEKRFAALADLGTEDWEERAARKTLRRHVARRARRLWGYLDGTVELERDETAERVELSALERYAAVIYPHAPSPDVRLQVEDGFGEYGISVIWLDEPAPDEADGLAGWTTLYEQVARSA
jgi:hypothetical protein